METTKMVVERLVDLVIQETKYLCCFKSYVENFDETREILTAKLQNVNIEIEKASGVSRFKNEAQQWLDEANDLINVETKKEKCFNDLCLNCLGQYQRSKKMAETTLQIEELLERSNFNIDTSRAGLPSVNYYPFQDFIHFKSRKAKFQELIEAFEGENCNMIGLQGMGGIGKTSLAKEVGAKLLESRFGKVIFLGVSMTPDFKRIRGEIAMFLDLNLDDGTEENHSETILSKITGMKERLLIILDDVWKEFDLKKYLGIPSSHQHEGSSVLITTCDSRVCEAMECQRTIHLETLIDEEALDLFQIHASIDISSHGLEYVAQKIVKQCEGVPIAIITAARTLKGRPASFWKETLKALENYDARNLSEAYKGPKLLYDNLENEKAKELFWISSLFPEGYEIPMEFLCKIGIGLGLFGEVDKYHSARKNVIEAINDLIRSSLLLRAEEEHVKMSNLAHKMALLIGSKDIQSVMDFKTPIKEDLRYLSWKNDDFLNEFDGKKLEIFIVFLDGSNYLKVPDTFFAKMTRLKVLFLMSKDQISAPSLSQSLQSLEDIRTLTLANLKLEDMSILKHLLSLETLSFRECSILKLPKFLEMKKLRLLELEECKIKMNNPFEVIEGCSHLQELTFVHNAYVHREKNDAISQNITPLMIDRYQISSTRLSDYFKKHGSMSRCFRPDNLRHLVSEATFKHLVGAAELLMLGGYKETRWKNLIPDIVSVDDGGMKDTIILHLYSWPGIQRLVDTKNDYSSDVTVFPNLVELSLYQLTHVEDLWGEGFQTFGFLNRLEIMKLEECPMLTSIFVPHSAQNLKNLKDLIIKNCNALKYIMRDNSSGGEIVGDDDDSDEGRSYDTLFPKLRTLQIAGCDKLKIISPFIFSGGLPSLEKISICDCKQLKYIFGKYQEKGHVMLPALKEMELSGVPRLIGIYGEYHKPISSSSMQKPSSPIPSPATRAFSWLLVCCFLRATKEANDAVSKERFDHTTSQELDASINAIQVAQSSSKLPSPGSTFSWAQGLLASTKWLDTVNKLTRQLLINVRHIKKINLANLSLNSISLFTLSMASIIMWKELTIIKCNGLKHITSEEYYYNDQTSCISIFPKLEKLEIVHCKDMEILYPSKISVGLKNLRFFTVNNAHELKYVYGKYHDENHLPNQNENAELHFDLTALEVLCLQDVPKFISICPMNYYLASPSLESVVLQNCGIKSITDVMVCSDESQPNQKTPKKIHASLNNIREIKLMDCPNLMSLLTLPTAASTILLEKLTIERCQQLKCIVADKEDARAHMNHNSIFPELKVISVSKCDALECLFPTSAIASPIKLKSLIIHYAPELKYVFGRSHYDDHLSHENQNIQYIDFPALKILNLKDVPNLASICPKNYYLRGPPRNSIHLELSPEIDIRSVTDFMICGHTTQQDSTTTTKVTEEERVEIEEDEISGMPKMTMSTFDSKYTGQLVTEDEIVEIFEEDDISEMEKMTTSTFDSNYIGQDEVVGKEVKNETNKDELVSKEVKNETIMMDPQQSSIGTPNCTKDELVGSEVEKETITTDLQSLQDTRQDIQSKDSKNISEVKVEGDNNASETLHSSPNLTVLPIRDSNPMTSKSMENKEEEEGGLIINASSSLPKEKHETFVSDDPFAPIILNEQTSEAIRPLSPLTSKASTSTHNQTPPSSLSNSTNEEDLTTQSVSDLTKDSSICPSDCTHGRNIHSGVETTNQRTPEVVDDVQVSDMPQAPAIVSVQDESGANVASHGNEVNSSGDVRVDPSPLTRRAEKSLYSRSYSRKIVGHHDSTEPNIEDSQSSLPPFSAPEEMATSLLQTNQASTVTGVQEIVDMMKLEGFEPSILAKALETHPQLILSVNDRRSTRVLSLSYRVLLDILYILTTRTPFTITEADRRLLEEHLNDAYFLGFDKDWLDSIKTRVFGCDTSEVDDIQKVLKSLDNDLKTNEEELAAIRDEEVEAARVVDAAEQEHANDVARHSRLLKARQDILARRHQCWEIIAAKNRHFGF